MSDIRRSLEELALEVGDLRAALVFESSGIDVATWGDAEFESATVELASVWKNLSSAEIVSSFGGKAPDFLEIRVQTDSWMLIPVGQDYLLALLVGPAGVPGRARFYGTEWAHRHKEDFS